jgi:hypothetical protein
MAALRSTCPNKFLRSDGLCLGGRAPLRNYETFVFQPKIFELHPLTSTSRAARLPVYKQAMVSLGCEGATVDDGQPTDVAWPSVIGKQLLVYLSGIRVSSLCNVRFLLSSTFFSAFRFFVFAWFLSFLI